MMKIELIKEGVEIKLTILLLKKNKVLIWKLYDLRVWLDFLLFTSKKMKPFIKEFKNFLTCKRVFDVGIKIAF